MLGEICLCSSLTASSPASIPIFQKDYDKINNGNFEIFKDQNVMLLHYFPSLYFYEGWVGIEYSSQTKR